MIQIEYNLLLKQFLNDYKSQIHYSIKHQRKIDNKKVEYKLNIYKIQYLHKNYYFYEILEDIKIINNNIHLYISLSIIYKNKFYKINEFSHFKNQENQNIYFKNSLILQNKFYNKLIKDFLQEYKKRDLWEILVPTCNNNGELFQTSYHKLWDKEIEKISGGLTILTPTKGKWLSPCGKIFDEKMIPVRILANKEEIHLIIDMTIKFYNQKAVLAYKLSNEVILKENLTFFSKNSPSKF